MGVNIHVFSETGLKFRTARTKILRIGFITVTGCFSQPESV